MSKVYTVRVFRKSLREVFDFLRDNPTTDGEPTLAYIKRGKETFGVYFADTYEPTPAETPLTCKHKNIDKRWRTCNDCGETV